MRKKYYLCDPEEFVKMKFKGGLESIFLYSRKPKVPYAKIKIKILKREPRYEHERKETVFKYKCIKIGRRLRSCFEDIIKIIRM